MRWVKSVYDWGLEKSAHPRAVWGLCSLAFFEAVFFPVPPDVLLIPMCLSQSSRALVYAGLCTVASVGGGVLGYFVGYALWNVIADSFYAYVPGFTRERFVILENFYARYNFLIVFTAGFTPLPYKLFTVSAGVFHIHFLWFCVASVVGRASRFFVLGTLIYYFGDSVKDFVQKYFNYLTVAVTLVLLVGYVLLILF